MRFVPALSTSVIAAMLVVSCGGSSRSQTESPTTPTNQTPNTPTTPNTPAPVTPASTECTTYGDRKVTLNRTTASFVATPLNADELRLITNGEETNDPRFVYVWIKDGGSASIYAPADGVLIRIRHKAPNSQFASEDWDFFFLVACDPARRIEGDTIIRFNHITNPREDLLAAFSHGSLPAPQFEPVFNEYEERQIPTTNIPVRAGEYLGYTRGTPGAHNFDFQIAINNTTVCPFDPLPDPSKSLLRALLGPGPTVPGNSGVPQAGYRCSGFGQRP